MNFPECLLPYVFSAVCRKIQASSGVDRNAYKWVSLYGKIFFFFSGNMTVLQIDGVLVCLCLVGFFSFLNVL